jgi:S-formylglutathione hydrolase FrmB
MLALRNPSRYGLFGDFSGLARPTVGPTDDPATTIRVLFHGSRAAFDQHDPLWLMRHHRYPTLAGWVAYGVGDAKAQADAARMLAAGRDATLPMHEDAAPGRHDWATWTAGFARMLPWLWSSLR